MSGPPSGVHGPPPGFTLPPGVTFGPPPGVTFPGGPPRGPPITSSSQSPSSTGSPIPSSSDSITPLPSFTPDPSNQSSSPPNNPQSQQEHKSSIVGPLVGGVVGALILLALLIGWRGVIWLRRRRKQRLEEKGLASPATPREPRDMEAALPTSQAHESVTPYLYNRPGEIVPASASTLTNSVAPKKGPGYGVDSILVAHNGIDPDARSLARSASTWTADSKHASTIMSHTTGITPSSPGGMSVSTYTAETPSIRVDPNIRISNNNPPLEAVIERPVVGEDIPPPYQRDVA